MSRPPFSFFRRWRGRRAMEQQMRDEMEFHLDSRIATLMAQGMPPEEATRTARMEFGGIESHREECRAAFGYRPWDELRSDVRFAARSLRHQPGYAITAIAILALAIGVNSAFFILFSHHVLRPLPVRGAERHFDLRGLDSRAQSTGGWTATEIDALRHAGGQSIEGLFTNRTVQMLVLEPAQRRSLVSFVSGNYFPLLASGAAAGRVFSHPEQREPVAVLSRNGQRRYFGDGDSPIGRKLRIRTSVFTVIGVMPEGFTGTEMVVPDLWIGAEWASMLLTREDGTEPRFSLSGLLAPGATVSDAESILSSAASRFPRPQERLVARVEIRTRSAFVARDAGFDIAAGLVFAAFLTVLVIACANLANVCLARASWRTHEIAMRLSLGASRGRIVRQLLTESTFIALLGAAGGIGLGMLAADQAQTAFSGLADTMGIVMVPVEADWRVLLFSSALGVIAGLAFGLLPAIEATSPSLTASTKRDHSSFAGRIRPRRMRDMLIIGQVASSFVLLMIAGILVRHIRTLDVTSPGYDLDRIFDLKVDRPQPALLARLERQPSVVGVTAVQRVLLHGEMNQYAARAGGQTTRLSYNYVDHRFFETLALSVRGRGFTAQDAEKSSKVVIISEATARRLWPAGTPFGQSITIDQPQRRPGEAAGTYEVIGVVPDVVSGWLFRGKDPTAIYFPAAVGHPMVDSAMVRISGQPGQVIAAIREICAGVPDAAGCEPTSLREMSGLHRFPFAAAASVGGALGGLALILTAVGLYGVISYSVVHRRREIGVHLALGASPAQVARRILAEAWRCVVIGLVAGLPVCLVLSRLLSHSIFGIDAFAGTPYATVPTLLLSITTLACAVPACRAVLVDPSGLLREE
jgi:predicted permease